MKRQHVLIILAGATIIIGLAISLTAVPALSRVSSTPAAFDQSAIGFTAAHSQLQCGVKVPNGLAQCGSAASSCKNCHEVKGEDPVNAKGDWHTQHAFGDFCEFCHAGNVQATDEAAAHQGMVQPLGDVKANCSSCHADDYQAKAQTYAGALGVTISSGTSGSSQPPTDPSAPSAPAPQQPAAPQPPSAAQPAPIVPTPTSNEVIDYVAQYAASNGIVDVGNIVAAIVLVLLIIGGAGFVYWNEKRLRRMAIPRSTEGYVTFETDKPEGPKVRSGPALALEPIGEQSTELTKLQPILNSLEPRTLRALRIILSDRPRGEELLQSLSAINFALIEEMRRLDKQELSLLLALASETFNVSRDLTRNIN